MCVFEKWDLYFLCIKSFSNPCCRTRSTASPCSHTRPPFRASLAADEKRYRTPNPQRRATTISVGRKCTQRGPWGKMIRVVSVTERCRSVAGCSGAHLQRFPSQTSSSFIFQDHRCFCGRPQVRQCTTKKIFFLFSCGLSVCWTCEITKQAC